MVIVIEHKGKVFASLFIIANRLQTLGDKLDENLTVKQWLMIAIIHKFESDQLSVKEIASIAGVSHQNVMQMAQNLEKRGFVRILKDNTDRRIKRIVLTSQFQKYFINRNEREISFLNKLFSNFTDKNISELNSLLELLYSNIEQMEEDYSFN
ncbi:DNA-binding transcriptional regulator, MarR family [Anaerovirgula multivorans]|uniref:DNA-binding transcriptional regulator, MarR family n=1 Tax=Anaerovirgula multivorans TaxID=312168 RepID=A0A239JDE2_9FIRM|nr:MarR family transcriptional regulator [Anaerovirgula multivorans]SNT04066.1 DNA-binding transcriptional regulator, MarR family [Anaerovirgula multivorans]